MPDRRQPALNQLYLREGRLPERTRRDEVVVSDGFAEVHGLATGDTLRMIIGGRLVEVRISGIGLSPEFIYQVSPGHLMPDYHRYAILWMSDSALAAAYAMEGAFNSLSASLQRDADRAAVLDALDAALGRYGSTGAYGRDKVFSHEFFNLELQQLQAMAVVVPAIFLLVSAFLLHVVMARIIRGQRGQIAVLKAFGYGDPAIAAHYVQLTALIVLGLLGALVWALMPRPVAVAVTEVRTGPFEETVREEGRTQLRHRYTVSAPITGYLHHLRLEEGDSVESGDTLFRLQSLPPDDRTALLEMSEPWSRCRWSWWWCLAA